MLLLILIRKKNVSYSSQFSIERVLKNGKDSDEINQRREDEELFPVLPKVTQIQASKTHHHGCV
jgi:hypothetical protein